MRLFFSRPPGIACFLITLVLICSRLNAKQRFVTTEKNIWYAEQQLYFSNVPINTGHYVDTPLNVKGRVVDENNEPVIATISVKGTTYATGTNKNGEFLLINVNGNDTFVISAVNIEPLEVRIQGQSELGIIEVRSRYRNENEVILLSKSRPPSIQDFAIGHPELQQQQGDLLMRLNAILIERYLSDTDRTNIDSHFIKGRSGSQPGGIPRVYVNSRIFAGDISEIDPANIDSVIIIRHELRTHGYHPLDDEDIVIIALKKTMPIEQKKSSFGWIHLLLITTLFISFFGGKIIFKNSQGVKFGMEITGGLEHMRKFNRERNNDRFKKILQEKHMEEFQLKEADDVVKILKELDNPHDTKE